MFKRVLFLQNFENAQKNLFLFYTVQREEATKPQLKVEIEDGRDFD